MICAKKGSNKYKFKQSSNLKDKALLVDIPDTKRKKYIPIPYKYNTTTAAKSKLTLIHSN
jgi:hypothetical protein